MLGLVGCRELRVVGVQSTACDINDKVIPLQQQATCIFDHILERFGSRVYKVRL